MPKSVAILLDGGFILQKLPQTNPTYLDVYSFALGCIKNQTEELFRIFFYHCSPYEGIETHPISRQQIDFSSTPVAQSSKTLLERLAELDYVALRKGRLAFRGWVISKFATRRIQQQAQQQIQQQPQPLTQPTTQQPPQPQQQSAVISASDFTPSLTQKEVDIKIGLDVAWLSSKRIVDKIILVTGDTDLVPAMKFARREGVQVVIINILANSGQGYLKSTLKEHADEVRDMQFSSGSWSIM